jgi:hypothetical protein
MGMHAYTLVLGWTHLDCRFHHMPSYSLLLDTPWIVGSMICLTMAYSYFLKLHIITYMPTNSAQFAMANLR